LEVLSAPSWSVLGIVVSDRLEDGGEKEAAPPLMQIMIDNF
jgi:hypothetical protein